MRGLCNCDCGGVTPLATRTRNGNVRGQPTKWLPGHVQIAQARQRGPNLRYHQEDRGFVSLCWIADHHLDELGYACVHRKNASRAHIVSYEALNGPVPDGLVLDHLCRQPSCMRPDHLEPVTHAENVRRGLSAKLTWKEVIEIRQSPLSQRKLAMLYGVSKAQVANIRHNRSWKENG